MTYQQDRAALPLDVVIDECTSCCCLLHQVISSSYTRNYQICEQTPHVYQPHLVVSIAHQM